MSHYVLTEVLEVAGGGRKLGRQVRLRPDQVSARNHSVQVRQVREGDDEADPKEHLINALAAAHRDGDTALAEKLHKQLSEWSDDDENLEEKDETDTKGKESMESRQRRKSRGRSVVESRRPTENKVTHWANRLLSRR